MEREKKIRSKWKLNVRKTSNWNCLWRLCVNWTRHIYFIHSLTPSRFQYKYLNVREHRMCDSCQLCIVNGKTNQIIFNIPLFFRRLGLKGLTSKNETIWLESNWCVERVYSTTKEIRFKYSFYVICQSYT